jgi:hypothetical protein
VEELKVVEAARVVADQLEHAQDMFRKGQSRLCLAYLETVIQPGPVYWYAACTLLCQGIVFETPECECHRHGGDQCFKVAVLDGRTMTPVADPLYSFSTEIITVFSRRDWAGFVDRLRHVASSGREIPLACVLLSRLTQLQDQKAAGLL